MKNIISVDIYKNKVYNKTKGKGMKKIIILGCENSHAKNFLNAIKEDKKYDDIEVVGVFSEDKPAMQALSDEFGVASLSSYSDGVGKVDGVIVTARHGDNHYKYVKPYLKSGIPAFIDKPITVSETDALSLMRECKKYGVRVTGGSSLIHVPEVIELGRKVKENEGGATLGGIVRAPINLHNEYGGFYFYSQHLVEIVMTIFGRYPEKVKAIANGKCITVVFCYDNYNVTGLYTDGCYVYSAERFSESGNDGGVFTLDGVFKAEFDKFYSLLKGGEQQTSYDDFIAPVFVINAIDRSIKSGKTETVNYEKV